MMACKFISLSILLDVGVGCYKSLDYPSLSFRELALILYLTTQVKSRVFFEHWVKSQTPNPKISSNTLAQLQQLDNPEANLIGVISSRVVELIPPKE